MIMPYNESSILVTPKHISTPLVCCLEACSQSQMYTNCKWSPKSCKKTPSRPMANVCVALSFFECLRGPSDLFHKLQLLWSVSFLVEKPPIVMTRVRCTIFFCLLEFWHQKTQLENAAPDICILSCKIWFYLKNTYFVNIWRTYFANPFPMLLSAIFVFSLKAQYRGSTDFRPLRHIFVHFCGLPPPCANVIHEWRLKWIWKNSKDHEDSVICERKHRTASSTPVTFS